MKLNYRMNFILALLVVAGLVLACKFGDESQQANELIDKANKAIQTANDASQKGGKRIAEMEAMVAKVSSDEELEAARVVARECKETFAKARDSYKEASEGFSAASKLKIHEKFKEYTETKAAELTKRGEMMTAGIDESQALLDSKNQQDYDSSVKAIVECFNKAKGEADDLSKKAEKIREDNKDVFTK